MDPEVLKIFIDLPIIKVGESHIALSKFSTSATAISVISAISRFFFFKERMRWGLFTICHARTCPKSKIVVFAVLPCSGPKRWIGAYIQFPALDVDYIWNLDKLVCLQIVAGLHGCPIHVWGIVGCPDLALAAQRSNLKVWHLVTGDSGSHHQSPPPIHLLNQQEYITKILQ